MAQFGKALTLGLGILEALEGNGTSLTYNELMRKTGVAPASFARFLKILVERGYVSQGPEGQYALGWRLAVQGRFALDSRPLRALARPHLLALMEETRETTEIVQYEGTHFLVLDRAESPQAIFLRAQAGSRFQTDASHALGQVGLAYGLVPPRGIPKEKLKRVRKRRYAEAVQNDGQAWRGVAAIVDARGHLVGGLGIAAPAFRVKAAEKKKYEALLTSHAGEISLALGWSGHG